MGSQDSECRVGGAVLCLGYNCLIDSPLTVTLTQSQHRAGAAAQTSTKLTNLTHCHSQTILLWTNFDDLAFRWGVFMRQVVVFRSYMTKQIATYYLLCRNNTLNMLNSWSCLAVVFTSLSIITSHPVKNRALLWSKKTFVWSAFTLRFPKIVGLKCFFHSEWYFSG